VKYQLIPDGNRPCGREKGLCLACRLFGAQGYQGHVSFEDAVTPKGSPVLLRTPLLWTPARDGCGLPPRYLERDRAKGRKFYRHASPASGADPRACIESGAELPLRIHFLNLSEAELGVLFTALGLHPDHRFPIKLGGGKPVGLGSVQIILNRVTLLQGVDALKATGRLGQAKTLAGDDLNDFLTQCANAADELIDDDALGKLKTILDKAGLQETAPADPY
jgi:hypothetical protein